MLNFSIDTLRDKIHACWIGKNIGGTIGGPYEYTKEIQSLTGYTTPKGAALPNDDLDLQIIWLKALEERGAKNLTAAVLAEYWLNFIPPSWNEYGIGKSNLTLGLLPPLSGEYENYWKNSNGAWIRSEVWACLCPGCPDIAIKYAAEDACVDHGISEGTYAEIFTAAMQSAAFVISDIRALINIGLSKIPAESRLAKSINTAISGYDAGEDWKDVRNRIVADVTADLGWFMAPANVAFVVLGLLYGEGDFKKSLLCAVNCGDDTDCTAATVGALLGIVGGTNAIPDDWREYIGDDIKTVAINSGDVWGMVRTCSELTEKIIKLMPCMLTENYADVSITTTDDFGGVNEKALSDRDFAKKLCARPAYSYDIEFFHTRCRVAFDGSPKIKPGGDLKVHLTFKSIFPEPRNLCLRWILPEGWSVDCDSTLYLRHWYNFPTDMPTEITATLHAGENVEPFNRPVIEAYAPGRPTVGYIPVTVLG